MADTKFMTATEIMMRDKAYQQHMDARFQVWSQDGHEHLKKSFQELYSKHTQGKSADFGAVNGPWPPARCTLHMRCNQRGDKIRKLRAVTHFVWYDPMQWRYYKPDKYTLSMELQSDTNKSD